jgi:hypothetical protein
MAVWARCGRSTLAGLETRVGLADHIHPAAAANHLAIRMAVFQGFEGRYDFHGSAPDKNGRTKRSGGGVSTDKMAGIGGWVCNWRLAWLLNTLLMADVARAVEVHCMAHALVQIGEGGGHRCIEVTTARQVGGDRAGERAAAAVGIHPVNPQLAEGAG